MPAGRPKGQPKSGGRQKGYKAPKTLAKEAAREVARLRITERLVPIVDAQIESAIGISHFFLKDAAGQFERITDEDRILAALNKGKGFWIHTKDPNTQAAREMLAYAIDKPKDQAQELEITGGETLIAALHQGRARAAAKKKGTK